MRVFAYCAKSYERMTRRAAGVEPLTCPPVWTLNFDSRRLEGHDFLYFDLHGQPGEPQWYGDGARVALTEDQINRADLSGAVVFATSCWLGDEDSPMLDALLDAGAEYVIGGPGENYAYASVLLGAGLLALWFRRLYALGLPVLTALALAKKRLNYGRGKRTYAAMDAREFKAYWRPEE